MSYTKIDLSSITELAITDVWPMEDDNFTPWLEENIDQLDKVLGFSLSDPKREVDAGGFRVDLVAKSPYGGVVIENQFGWSDNKHLGQLVTYITQKRAQVAIWIVEAASPAHVEVLKKLNEDDVGQFWMLSVRAIRIDDSLAAPDFSAVVRPPKPISDPAKFFTSLFKQLEAEDIDSPFRHSAPPPKGLLHVNAKGPNLVYRVAVNSQNSRSVLTNSGDKWVGAYKVLKKSRTKIEEEFAEEGLRSELEWDEWEDQRWGSRWSVIYRVDVSHEGAPDPRRLRELNRACAAMKKVFGPYLEDLDPKLEDG